MVGSSDESDYLPTSRQALNRPPQFFPMVFFMLLFASLLAAGSVSAQEHAACDQYGCAEGSAACDQYGCTADPMFEDSASAGKIDSTATGTSLAEIPPKVRSTAPIEENVGVAAPTTTESDEVIQQSMPASAVNAQYQTTDPTLMFHPDLILKETEATNTETPGEQHVEHEIEREASTARAESSAEEGAKSEDPESTNEDENSDKEKNTDEPLSGYPYKGEPCEESSCGLEDIEAPIECATYEAASGKKIYGCSNPKLYETRDCYEVTFYTEDGRPYSNLDTCSGEKQYAPPEPPEGYFGYFEPPSQTIVNQDWDPMLEPDQCFFNKEGEWSDGRKGDKLDPHCGLEGLSAKYDCGVYYSTVHGTVRGCFKQYLGYTYDDPVTGCSWPLQIYDEAGRRIGTYESCPKVRQESCKSAECGTSLPRGWTCRREHWDYGTLYGGEKRTFRRCVSPKFDEFLAVGGLPCKKTDGRLLAAIYDERGHRVYEIPCGVGGSGGDLGEWAGMEAEQADETLNATEDISQSNRSEENEIRPEGEGTVAGSAMSPASDSGKLRDLFGTARPAESTLAPSTGEEGMQEARPNITTLESSREPDRRFVNANATNADEHSSEVQSPANSDEARSTHNLSRSATRGKHATLHTDTVAEADKDSGVIPPSVERDTTFLTAPPGMQSIQRKSTNNSDETTAANLVAILSTGDDSVESSPSEFATGSADSSSRWSSRLVPLAGLIVAGGAVVLRRRFLR